MRKEKEVHLQRFPIVQIDRSICYSPSLHYLEHIVDCGNVGVGIIQDSGFFRYCGFRARTEGVLGFVGMISTWYSVFFKFFREDFCLPGGISSIVEVITNNDADEEEG